MDVVKYRFKLSPANSPAGPSNSKRVKNTKWEFPHSPPLSQDSSHSFLPACCLSCRVISQCFPGAEWSNSKKVSLPAVDYSTPLSHSFLDFPSYSSRLARPQAP